MKTETITSRHNPALVHVRKLLRSRTYREEHGQYAAEGTKLLQEALRWDAGVQMMLLSPGVDCPEAADTVRIIRVPQDVMQQLSLQPQPQGAIFVCRFPPKRCEQVPAGCLVLDAIQDPGNLGTILRTADALDVPVVLTEGCCDAYSPKTVRASMGAVFRTPPIFLEKKQVASMCASAGIRLTATAMGENAKDIRAVCLERDAVVIGSEGQGVSQQFLQAAEQTVVIPMQPRCESLNAAVAAAIVMWQMKRSEREL